MKRGAMSGLRIAKARVAPSLRMFLPGGCSTRRGSTLFQFRSPDPCLPIELGGVRR